MINTIKYLYAKNRIIFNYIIVGGLTTLVSLVTYYVCVLFFLNPNNAFQLQAANVLAWIAGVSFAYITNRKYVFKSKNQNRIKEAISFFLSRITTLLLDMGIMFFCVTLFHINDKISKIIVLVVVTFANYFLSKFLVFKQSTKASLESGKKAFTSQAK